MEHKKRHSVSNLWNAFDRDFKRDYTVTAVPELFFEKKQFIPASRQLLIYYSKPTA